MTDSEHEEQSKIEEAIERSLQNPRKIVAVYPAHLNSNEKLEVEERVDGFYWLLGELEDGPFPNVEAAHAGFKRNGEARFRKERRGE